MAIYHLTMKNISRTRRSTIASLAYRAGVKVRDPQTGDVFDYTSKPVSAVEFYKIIKNPDIILQDVCQQQTNFMWGDVAKYLARHVGDQALLERLLLKLEHSKELICVQKERQHSQSIFTTRTRLLEEKQFLERTEGLTKRRRHGVKDRSVEFAINCANRDLQTTLKDKHASLSQAQRNAIWHMASPAQLSLVEGYAGAGKTTVMQVMKEIWEENNYKVYDLTRSSRLSHL